MNMELSTRYITLLLVFVGFLNLQGFSQKDKKQDNVFYLELDDVVPVDTVEVHDFMGKAEMLNIRTFDDQCNIFLTVPVLHKSLLFTSSTCNQLVSDYVKRKTPLLDSLINFSDFNPSMQIPSHLQWLFQAYKNHKIINDKYVISTSKVELKSMPFKEFNSLKETIPQFIYNSEYDELFGEIPKLNLTNGSQSAIFYNPLPLTKAIDVRTFDLNPTYPVKVDSISTPHEKNTFYYTGHSVLMKTERMKDTTVKVLFVSDGVLWQNIQKLEYLSILKIKVFQNYVVILGESGTNATNYIYVVNYQTGKIYQINTFLFIPAKDDDKRYIVDFDIMEDELFTFVKTAPIYDDLEETRVDFVELLKVLEKLD